MHAMLETSCSACCCRHQWAALTQSLTVGATDACVGVFCARLEYCNQGTRADIFPRRPECATSVTALTSHQRHRRTPGWIAWNIGRCATHDTNSIHFRAYMSEGRPQAAHNTSSHTCSALDRVRGLRRRRSAAGSRIHSLPTELCPASCLKLLGLDPFQIIGCRAPAT